MVAGLTPVMPSGALYMMVGIELDKFPHISTGIDFMEKLMLEESVYILPGEVSDASQLLNMQYYRYIFLCLSVFNTVGSSDWCC